jgi:peptidoglycan hydrolase-like protein with peptidoglycan-binding domain
MRKLVSIAVMTVTLVLATTLLPAPALSADASGRGSQASCRRTLPSYPELAPGAEGKEVRTLQCVLNDAGLGPVTVDGEYGPETKAAVRKLTDSFEGPVPTPLVVKSWYWTILFAASDDLRGLERGDSGIRVKTLQRALRADGETLVVDGRFGAQTAGQVKVFQEKCQLKKTGRINDKTSFFLSQGGCNP